MDRDLGVCKHLADGLVRLEEDTSISIDQQDTTQTRNRTSSTRIHDAGEDVPCVGLHGADSIRDLFLLRDTYLGITRSNRTTRLTVICEQANDLHV